MERKTILALPAVVWLLLALVHCGATQAPPAPAPSSPPVAQAIRALEERRFAAMLHRDIGALRDILSDDLTYTHSSGQIETKAQFLESIASGTIQYIAILPESIDIRVYGDTAVVTGRGTFRVRLGGREEAALRLRFTDVYVRKSERIWQMVAWQSTRLPES